MQPYTPKSELLWRPDPNVDAARKLPDWKQFHRVCGQHGVFFDHIERKGRAYAASAFTAKKINRDLYHTYLLGEGTGPTVIAAIGDAYRNCGVTVPGAAEMLARGLTGEPADDFDALL